MSGSWASFFQAPGQGQPHGHALDQPGGDPRRQALSQALMRTQPSPQSYSGSPTGSVLGGAGSALSGLTSAMMADPKALQGLWQWLQPGGRSTPLPGPGGAIGGPAAGPATTMPGLY